MIIVTAFGVLALGVLFYRWTTFFVSSVHAQIMSTQAVNTNAPLQEKIVGETTGENMKEKENDVGGHQDQPGQNIDHQFEGVE